MEYKWKRKRVVGTYESTAKWSEFERMVARMSTNKKKLVAPIVVTIIMILYYVVYFGFLISLFDGIWKYALGIIPFIFSIVMIKVCIERIKEIKEGEEDDISKY